MLFIAGFRINGIVMLAVVQHEFPARYGGCPPLRGRFRLTVKDAFVYRLCAVQLDIVNKFLGTPTVDRYLAAADTQPWRRFTFRTDRRAIAIGIIDDQLTDIGTIVRLPVNVKSIAAAVYQSTFNRQRRALTKHQTAFFRTVYRQVTADGYVALNDVVLAAQNRIIFREYRTCSIKTGILYNVTICISTVRIDCYIRQRRNLPIEPAEQRLKAFRARDLRLLLRRQRVIGIICLLNRHVCRQNLVVIHRGQFVRIGQRVDLCLHGGHGFRAGLRLGFRFRVSARRFHGGRAVHRPQLVRQRGRGQERQAQGQRHEHTQYSFFHIFPP